MPDTNPKHSYVVAAVLFAQEGWFSLGETKSLRDRNIPIRWNVAPLCRLPLDRNPHFTPKAYPEGSTRSGSLPCIENPSPLWTQ